MDQPKSIFDLMFQYVLSKNFWSVKVLTNIISETVQEKLSRENLLKCVPFQNRLRIFADSLKYKSLLMIGNNLS